MSADSEVQSLKRASELEREAHELRFEGKNQQAFDKLDEAASLYQGAGEHFKAAVCYASAASCWNIHTGLQPVRNAASRSALAAEEALKAGHFDYARMLFADAALLYEKDGDFGNFSACFYRSKSAEGRFAWELFTRGQRDEKGLTVPVSWKERFGAFLRWKVNLMNRLLWGYGERPFRTLGVALTIILACALFYSLSGLVLTEGEIRKVSFPEGFYFSVITYTTVGFGDYLPTGWVRILAMLEALSGIFFAPLFLIALTRRYLRMYR